MSAEGKRVLIICYTFPPYPGIGGRRWAKFAKYLQRNGHDVSVIASENPFSDKTSEWNEDTKDLAIYRLPVNFPKALILYPSGIIGKLSYRLALMKVRLFGKGNYYDRALFWERNILNKASELIESKGIKNVIVTGAPFHLLYHCIKLKQKHPDIRLISDFRDFWVKDISLSALSTLTEERKNAERLMEEKVCAESDVITCVSSEMASYFNGIAGKEKSRVLLNGYDEEDFKDLPEKKRVDEHKIKFVFTGNLYNNLENVFHPFCDALLKIKKESPELYEKLQFDFYGTSPSSLKDFVIKNDIDAVSFHKTVSLRRTLEEINNSDYCMLFLNDVYSFSLSTKFCEYIGLKKKIVLFSQKGKASEYIVSNDLGYWMKPDTTFEDLHSLINSHISSSSQQPAVNFNYLQFSIKNIVSELEAYLI